MTEGSDYFVGTSIDQMYAQKFGQDTPLPSIQLCIEMVDASGACDYGYACVYADTISWASPTQPLPMTLDPRMAFENLFGEGGTPEERLARRQVNRSILDWIAHDVARLQKDLGASDRSRLNAYLEDVREIERRIQKIEKYNASGEARALPAAPLGVPDSFEEHVKLMFDLQALAFMTDVTRVSAFKMSRDVSGRVWPESGVKTPFHPCSHHGENPGEDRGVRQVEPVSREPAAVFPGEAEEHAGWRRQSAGPFDGAVRQPDGRFERTQSQARAAVPGWATPTAQLKGNLHVRTQGRDADGECAADDVAQAGRERRTASATAPAKSRSKASWRYDDVDVDLAGGLDGGVALWRRRRAAFGSGDAGRSRRRCGTLLKERVDVDGAQGDGSDGAALGRASTTIWKW